MAGLDSERLTVVDAEVRAEARARLPVAVGARWRDRWRHSTSGTGPTEPSAKLLEQLAAPAPLVLVLDDVHWADSASSRLLSALLRRPPTTSVLIALALRPRRAPARLWASLERADREGTLTRIELGGLSFAETRDLLGDALQVTEAAALYEETGGNPLYLQELARALDRADATAPAASELSLAIGVPSAVAAALTEAGAAVQAGARGARRRGSRR